MKCTGTNHRSKLLMNHDILTGLQKSRNYVKIRIVFVWRVQFIL
jgi:hypothetical protein